MCDQVREAVAGKRGEVVARQRGGLVWRGLIGGWVAASAGLVDGDADDDRDQQLLGGDGQRIGDARGAQDGQDAVGVAHGVGAHRDPADGEPDDVAVREDGRACAARDLLELLLPAAGIGIGDVHFSDHAVEDQIEEPVLGADVPVQRGGGDVQGARDVAHAQQVESVLVEHRECRIDDRLLGEQVASAPRRSLGRSRPRRRG